MAKPNGIEWVGVSPSGKILNLEETADFTRSRNDTCAILILSDFSKMAFYRQECKTIPMKFTRRFAAFTALVATVAMMTTGCLQPSFDELQPHKLKWSISVLAVAQSEEQKTAVQDLASNLAATQAMAMNVMWLDKNTDAAAALDKVADTPGVDLVLLTANASNLQALASKHPQVRFAVLDQPNVPSLANVRALTTQRTRNLFLAGFLAAEANKESNAPFSVYVDKVRPTTDPDWQAILAGSRFAGRKDVPLQVPKDALLPPTGSAEKSTGNAVKVTPSGRSILLLDELTADVYAKIHERGMKVIATDQSTKTLADPANLVAEPATLLAEALQEESSLLHDGKWTAQQQVELPGKQLFRLTQPEQFLDKSLATRLDLIEDQLSTGTLKPETYMTVKTDAN